MYDFFNIAMIITIVATVPLALKVLWQGHLLLLAAARDMRGY